MTASETPDDQRPRTLLPASAERLAVVAIGRNEGDRLRHCVLSALPSAALVVYVDSGSTDGSPDLARSLGAEVVHLDMRIMFTAARARNEGLARVQQRRPDIGYVQFVDGDCTLVQGWLDTATGFLDEQPTIAAVCGRRRERQPQRSVYNRLCDIEWDTPVGEAKACGGDAMMRVNAVVGVGGYRSNLIAGEEPELCVRMRAQGWLIWRLNAEMTLHDADMTRLGQWWKRAVRAGYAFAAGTALHGTAPERHWVKESRSAWIWGALLPVLILALTLAFGAPFLCGLLVYPLQVLRLYLRGGGPPEMRAARALFLVLGKFAEAVGQFRYLGHRWFGGQARIIEYK